MGECKATHLKMASLWLYSNNFGLKQLSTIVEKVISKALEYRAILSQKSVAKHFLMMSPC